MAASPVPPSGGHQIESAFGAAADPAPASERKPSRRRTGLILTALGILVIGATCAGTQWAANVGYDDALLAFEDAADDAEASQDDLERTLLALTDTTDVATTVAETDSGNLMDAASKETFTAALSEAAEAQDQAAELIEERLPEATEKPAWAWELFGATAELNTESDELVDDQSSFDEASSAVATASDAVNTTGTAAVLSAAEAAGAFESAHVSARNTDIIALRRAAERLSRAAALDATSAEAYAELESAAAQMLSSEQAELAEKQGPLHDARVEIEAFARDLAPGVLLDFDWSPLVNGYGEADSMGGYATWWYGEPGYANLELSDSVARYWPGDRSRALVAHEVGHAISVKCKGMYDDSDQGTIEAWATAWAIGMGFHDDANGTSAYGTPPQSLIDAAAACR